MQGRGTADRLADRSLATRTRTKLSLVLERLFVPLLLAAMFAFPAGALASPPVQTRPKPQTYITSNDPAFDPAHWVVKPQSILYVYPDHAALCCGITLHKLRWTDWGKLSAMATARTRVKVYDPWLHVKVRAYGRRVLLRSGDADGEGTVAKHDYYAYTHIAVTIPKTSMTKPHTVRWKLDTPEFDIVGN